MQGIKQKIIEVLRKVVGELIGQDITPNLEHPKDERHGDYATNIALTLFAKSKVKSQKSKVGAPIDLAREIASKFRVQSSEFRVTVVAPGFINFWLSEDYLTTLMIRIIRAKDTYGSSKRLEKKRIMVEFADPNTHKEMHIGHMRTLITGEALSRIFEEVGAKVFRANYQGDIGPHVAKAMFGIEKLMKERKLSLSEVAKWDNTAKAHFLGEAYVRGNQEYKEHQDKIDVINSSLYEYVEGSSQKSGIVDLYKKTRQWSLDYYDEFYKRFYTKFYKLFFESEMVARGKEIVQTHLGNVFKQDQGAIVFKGEPYGLHTRVFITQAGYPTYEGKEMANALEEYEAFAFNKKIHVVASEQAEYFKVVFKALELIDAEKFKDRQYHIPMGMVHLVDRKMSSRTGDVLTVDSVIDQVKEKVNSIVESGKIKKTGTEDVAEEVAIGAIKYSVLKVDTKQDVAFDIEKSVSLEGNSGPYLQYAYARTQSVVRKSEIRPFGFAQGENPKSLPANASHQALQAGEINSLAKPDQNTNVQKVSPSPVPSPLEGEGWGEGEVSNFDIRVSNLQLEPEEVLLLRATYRFPEIVEEAAENFAPNLLCNYLFDLSQKFNLFYQRLPIINPRVQLRNHPRGAKPTRVFRLSLTAAVGQVIKNGLYLLGIKAPERM